MSDTGFKSAVRDITLKIAPKTDVALFSVSLVLAVVFLVLCVMNYSATGITGSVFAALAAAGLVAITQFKNRLGPNQLKVAVGVLALVLFLGLVMGIVGTVSPPPTEDEDKRRNLRTKLRTMLAAGNPDPAPAPAPSPAQDDQASVSSQKSSSAGSTAAGILIVIFVVVGILALTSSRR
jgi:hypothetical protein